MKETGRAGYLVMPVYNNVVRMAMTPFLHACFSAIFGYFIALGVAQRRHRLVFFLLGLSLSSLLHGLYDTFVGESPLLGVAIQCGAFFLVMTYILKARGLSSARELGGGVFSRTVMMKPLEAVVLPDGSVDDHMKITRSLDDELDQQAMKAVRQWTFRPGTKDDKAVAVLVSIELSFTLRDKPSK